jgi:hypothetical protein
VTGLCLAASPWELGWNALVAIGTLALALATLTLAYSTRSLAKETAEEVGHSARQTEEAQHQVAVSQEQARIAKESLTVAQDQTRIAELTLGAQIRPVLVDVPLELGVDEPIFYPDRDEPIRGNPGAVHVSVGPEGTMVSVPLRNAGAGLAMIRGVGLRVGEAIPSPPVTIRPANVAPGERARVSFATSPDDPATNAISGAIAAGSLSVEVGYSDLAGGQYTVSRLDVHFRSRAHWNWEVRQVHLQELGANEPFAGSAPTA